VNPVAGTNSTVAGPLRCQLPGTAGVTVGIGELAASGSEKVTVIGAVPLTPVAWAEGEIDTTLTGLTIAACVWEADAWA